MHSARVLSLQDLQEEDVVGSEADDDQPITASPWASATTFLRNSIHRAAESFSSTQPEGPAVGPEFLKVSPVGDRRRLQDESSKRLSMAEHRPRTNMLLAIIDEENQIKARFTGNRAHRRDPTRTIDQVLYDDAAVIRHRLDRMRKQHQAELRSAREPPISDSKLAELKKARADIVEKFVEVDEQRCGRIDRSAFRSLLAVLEIIETASTATSSSLSSVIDQFWSILKQESNGDLVPFSICYRYLILILFPVALTSLEETHRPKKGQSQFEKAGMRQVMEQVAIVPSLPTSSIPLPESASHDNVNPSFFQIGRKLVNNAILIRLMHPINQSARSNTIQDTEFNYHPNVIPRSELLASRARKPGGRRFVEELQREAVSYQRRRDARMARAHEQELEPCTFRPKLDMTQATSGILNRFRDPKNRFEILYQHGVRRQQERKAPKVELRQPSPVREFHMKEVPAAVYEERPMPRGFRKTVERSRRAARLRLKAAEDLAQLGQEYIDRYNRRERFASRRNTRRHTDDARHEEWFRTHLTPRSKPIPLLNVDVEVSNGRMGRIAIFQHSQPEALAKNFAKLYMLDEKRVLKLTQLLGECGFGVWV